MTVRLAIGCGPGRLMRQLLTEGLILSTLAAAGWGGARPIPMLAGAHSQD